MKKLFITLNRLKYGIKEGLWCQGDVRGEALVGLIVVEAFLFSADRKPMSRGLNGSVELCSNSTLSDSVLERVELSSRELCSEE